MPELSAEQIAQRALDLDLIDDRTYRAVCGEARNLDAAQFQQLLLRRELLTPYQLERLLKGERAGFFYGKCKAMYQIGAGTFARVYRGVHRDTGQVVAIKVLRRRFSDDNEKREQFYKEAEVGRTLRHPNIVGITDVGNERTSYYIIMEFVEGQTLREFLKVRKRLPPLDSVRLMADITRGLDYAFRRGISHRDLKASNVLVSSSGQAKLVDFGLAGVDEDTSDETLAGVDNPRTLDYVALERASGVHRDDNRSDIYFAGCIMYHMLAGQPPLEETRDRFKRLSTTRLFEVAPLREFCREIPPPVAAVVDKAMALDPKLRYQTPGEMLTDLTMLQTRLAEGGNMEGVQLAAVGAKQRVLMIVESNARIQDTLRTQLKQQGYRVLVTSDPQRPLQWFAGGMAPADCALFSTADLGEAALESFNAMAGNTDTARVPAVLLLGSRHRDWAEQARVSDHRATLTSPFKLQDLLDLLGKVLKPQA